jgi:hypothetical protein
LQYLGDFAETAEIIAIHLELANLAATLGAATPRASSSTTAISAQSIIQRFPSSHPKHSIDSPLAQASVRSPLSLQKEITTKQQDILVLAASTIAASHQQYLTIARTPAARTSATRPSQSVLGIRHQYRKSPRHRHRASPSP